MMSFPATAELTVSRSGVIATLGDQFTSSTTFLTELLQNARRAGAKRIDLSFDESTGKLIIEDDGCGISGPDALFQLGKSAWQDIQVMAQENPFGIGFAASLFAADQMLIESNGWKTEFETDDLLSFKLVDIQNCDRTHGTRLTLTLKDHVFQGDNTSFSRSEQIQGFLNNNLKGFPIPVFFEDVEIPRPHALEFLEGVELTKEGHVWLCRDAYAPGIRFQLYLQGLPISTDFSHRDNRPYTIVHLDSRAFRARVPDRDVLIDSQAALCQIAATVADCWRGFLKSEKARMTPGEFVARWEGACVTFGCTKLLDDCPLPQGTWNAYATPTHHRRWFSDDAMYLHSDDRGGGLLLDETTQILKDIEPITEDNDQTSMQAAYAFKLGWPVLVYPGRISEGHWAKRNAVSLNDALQIEVIEPLSEQRFFSSYDGFDIVFCERYMIHSTREGLPSLEIDDVPAYCPITNKLVMPRHGYIWAGEVLLQFSSYMDEHDDFAEGDHAEDTNQLRALCTVAFQGDLSGVLKGAILESTVHLRRNLRATTFHVTFDEDGHPLVAQVR